MHSQNKSQTWCCFSSVMSRSVTMEMTTNVHVYYQSNRTKIIHCVETDRTRNQVILVLAVSHSPTCMTGSSKSNEELATKCKCF